MTAHKHIHVKELSQDFVFVKGFPSVAELGEWLTQGATIYFLFPVAFKQESSQIELHSKVKDVLALITDETTLTYQAVYRRVNTLVLSQEEVGQELEDFNFELACELTLKKITPRQPSGLAKQNVPSFG